MNKLRVDIWSDIACPWCYVGKRHLEEALSRFAARDSVEVVWRAFELDPAAPPVRDASMSYSERLGKKYGVSKGKADAMLARMVDVAAADGLEFRFDRIKSGNTFNAHRLLHLAHERGVQDAVKERLLRAYMTEGEPIGDLAALERVAVESGLDRKEVHDMLASQEYVKEVRADEEEARRLGITGVPFFVVAGRYGLSGAQPSEVLLEALNQAWAEIAPQHANELTVPEGATCGPEGCL